MCVYIHSFSAKADWPACFIFIIVYLISRKSENSKKSNNINKTVVCEKTYYTVKEMLE